MSNSHTNDNHHPVLSSAKDLLYVNEGGANVIFRSKTLSSSHTGHLIRLRKESQKNDIADVCDSLLFLEEAIISRLGRDTVVKHRRLIIENPHQILRELNSTLREMERVGTRPSMRHGVYLNECMTEGLLVEDMVVDGEASRSSFTTRDGVAQPAAPLIDWHIDTKLCPSINPFGKLFSSNIRSSQGINYSRKSLLVEWKPKWLGQSPDAPFNSVRCRNCALRLCRNAKEEIQISSSVSCQLVQPTPKGKSPCPLALVSEDPEHVQKLANSLLTSRHQNEVNAPFLEGIPNDLISIMCKVVLTHTTVFRSLKRFQESLDRHGVLSLYDEFANQDAKSLTRLTHLSLAMSLRDCSAYLLFWQDTNIQYQAELKARYSQLRLKNDFLHNENGLSAFHDPVQNIYLFRTPMGSGDNPEMTFMTAKLRLGDFDRKFDKLSYWHTSEKQLVEGNWYVKS